jgi:ubiquitin-protein ligase
MPHAGIDQHWTQRQTSEHSQITTRTSPPIPTASLAFLSSATASFAYKTQRHAPPPSPQPSHPSYSPTLPPTMASSASKRLFKEYKALSSDPPEGITAGPISEDDMFLWEALIQGPEGTPFEGGVFPAELKFPKDYPLAPPTMRFLVEVWHPNGMLEPVALEYLAGLGGVGAYMWRWWMGPVAWVQNIC